MRLYAACIALCCFSTTIAYADSEIERASLRGLKGVSVLIDEMSSPAAKGAGLDEVTFRTDVELKLRLAGIRVLTKSEVLSEPGRPQLHIRIVATGTLAFSIDCELIQDVLLNRDPKFSIPAPTWARAEVGNASGAKAFAQYARDGVKDLTDQFINAYLAVNPKK